MQNGFEEGAYLLLKIVKVFATWWCLSSAYDFSFCFPFLILCPYALIFQQLPRWWKCRLSVMFLSVSCFLFFYRDVCKDESNGGPLCLWVFFLCVFCSGFLGFFLCSWLCFGLIFFLCRDENDGRVDLWFLSAFLPFYPGIFFFYVYALFCSACFLLLSVSSLISVFIVPESLRLWETKFQSNSFSFLKFEFY